MEVKFQLFCINETPSTLVTFCSFKFDIPLQVLKYINHILPISDFEHNSGFLSPSFFLWVSPKGG